MAFHSFFVLVSIVSIVFSFCVVSSDDNEQHFWHTSTEHFEIAVDVNDSTLQYSFWEQNSPTLKYFLHFVQIFEAVSEGNDIGMYSPSLINTTSFNWSLTNVTQALTNDSSVLDFYFNVSATNVTIGNTTRFDKLLFAHQIELTNESLTVAIAIELNNYRWISTDRDTSLVFLFRFAMSANLDQNQGKQATGSEVILNSASFSIDPRAITLPNDGSVDVDLYMIKKNNNLTDGMWIIYDHFGNSFMHRVRFGIDKKPPLGLIIGLAVLAVILISTVIIIIVLIARKRRSYALV